MKYKKDQKDDNIQGNEARNMHMLVTLNYIVNGDPMWLLRQCRNIGCKYMRALSRTYPFMRSEEKLMLLKSFFIRFLYVLNMFL